MYGAILGDMIGAPYEFDRGNKTKDFSLFTRKSVFTDDSVMTIAVAEALMDTEGKTDIGIKNALVSSMQKWGRKYPNAGYGGMFRQWLKTKNPKPYGSFGNGAAMRVSSIGWLGNTMEETMRLAKLSAEVTHNHSEGIKGAQATAGAIFMARTGKSKEEIRDYIVTEFGYDLSRTCDEIRPTYYHVESCQETVPEAITAFLEGVSFEDVIRTAVSLGGDCDTLTCIAGGIAEAFYGVTDELKTECRRRLTREMLEVLDRFEEKKIEAVPKFQDPFLEGNDRIETAISAFYTDSNKYRLIGVVDAIFQRMHADGHFIVPVEVNTNDENSFLFRVLQTNDGKLWQAVFTSQAEYEKGEKSQIVSHFIDSMVRNCLDSELAGIIINPWGQSFLLTKELMELMIKADEEVLYTVPDDPLTADLLKDGEFLTSAVGICHRNPTQVNRFKLLRILRDSYVWIPCNAILSDADYQTMEKMVKSAMDSGDDNSLIGQEFCRQDALRMVPDVLQSDDGFFFPVFTTADEMGEYGNNFSKVEKHFLEALALAKNNEKNVSGIVINAFSEPVEIDRELFSFIEEMESGLEVQNENFI